MLCNRMKAAAVRQGPRPGTAQQQISVLMEFLHGSVDMGSTELMVWPTFLKVKGENRSNVSVVLSVKTIT